MYPNGYHIDINSLKQYKNPSKVLDNNEKTKALYKQQKSKKGFPLLRKNLIKIKLNKTAMIKLNEVEIQITLNKTRENSIRSNVSNNKNVKNKCKLCNLPEDQKGFPILNNKYFVLTNPGITIPGDLTIPSFHHQNQEIKGRFEDMLDLAEQLYDYSIYYNGLRAGASSPHFHFQAGLKDKLPAEKQFDKYLQNNSNKLSLIYSTKDLNFYKINNFIRSCYLVISENKYLVHDFFKRFYKILTEINKNFNRNINVPEFGEYISSFGKNEEEPRMNIMLKFLQDKNKYLLSIFPKKFNRPKSYYREQNKILLGMGIKEELGNLITCRLKDFNRLKNNPIEVKKAFKDTSISQKEEVKLESKFE